VMREWHAPQCCRLCVRLPASLIQWMKTAPGTFFVCAIKHIEKNASVPYDLSSFEHADGAL
jgi:hypothetical protein